LTAVVAAGLALYDMVKAVDRAAQLSEIRLIHKAGGRSGEWSRPREASG
jgi:cyclic pyranopterin phosphate synthase